jgi:hypothetical protein
MRTKLVLGAAILAAGLASSMADNVYSLNVVGYYNVTAPAGFSIFVNQLNTDTNGINEVLPTNPQDGDQVYTFNNGIFNIDVTSGGSWVDNNTYDPSTTTLSPGQGFFFWNNGGAAETRTFVGTVPQGLPLPAVHFPVGFGLVGNPIPAAVQLDPTNGCPLMGSDGNQYYVFDHGAYDIDVTSGGQWVDNNTYDPVPGGIAPPVGIGYFIWNNQGAAMDWVYSFTVQ